MTDKRIKTFYVEPDWNKTQPPKNAENNFRAAIYR
jgi:hypothetical protein